MQVTRIGTSSRVRFHPQKTKLSSTCQKCITIENTLRVID